MQTLETKVSSLTWRGRTITKKTKKNLFNTFNIHFVFITVRCLVFREAWSYTYTRIRTCSVFNAHTALKLHEYHIKREYRSQCKGKGISMKVIALWANHNRTVNHKKQIKTLWDKNDDYVMFCMLYMCDTHRCSKSFHLFSSLLSQLIQCWDSRKSINFFNVVSRILAE